MKSTTLYFKEGQSDKVYQASIQPKGPGFVVNFAYGRRGSTLSTGSKTSAPVELKSAELIYDKLVREKKAKGYTEGRDGTPYSTEETKEYSGIQPQLLNPIEEEELERFIASPDWVMQEKFDGKRLLLLKEGSSVRGINRKGLFCGVPEPILRDARLIRGSFLIDGECVGDHYHVFDLLSWLGRDQCAIGYRQRMAMAVEEIGLEEYDHVRAVHSYIEPLAKRILVYDLRTRQAEGVAIKELNAIYTAGRPNSGGTQLKCKFYATASFVVLAANRQRSVQLGLDKDGMIVPAGNVTVPPNQVAPKAGHVVEVRYLYALQQSGVVYQPTLLGRREDVAPEECKAGQLKFKQEAAGDSDE